MAEVKYTEEDTGGDISWREYRRKFAKLALSAGEYGGIPVPVPGIGLTVEPTFKIAKLLMEETNPNKNEKDDGWAEKKRNVFYSHSKRCDVYVWNEDGKVVHGLKSAIHSLDHLLATLSVVGKAWSLEQEMRAMKLLSDLLTNHQWTMYAMSGAFVERSKRSGVMYMFRRLRPTVALRARDNEECKILAALCLHPIAYYAGSWAGGMCPTDDVIAHLMLMRGDEPMFWRRANQHAAHRPEAGL